MDKLIGTSMLLLLLLLISYFAIAHPLFTWDIVPYVAATLSAQISEPSALHDATYQILQSSLSETQFSSLVSGPYAADLWKNSDHFSTQLNMYYVKPLYVAVLRAISGVGVNPITAVMGISLISGLLICSLMFQWLKSVTTWTKAAVLVILFALSARLIDLSRVPTPDNFSALLVLAGIYLLLVKKWLLPAAIVLSVSVLIRTNNMVFVGLVLSCLIWSRYSITHSVKDSQFQTAAIGLILSISLYLITNAVFDYQWWRLFYHTFIESQVNIGSFDRAFSMSSYLTVLKTALQQLIVPGAFIASALPFFLLILIIPLKKTIVEVLTTFVIPTTDINLEQIAQLSVPVFLTVFLLFPSAASWDRFFTAQYALIFIYCVSEWHHRRSNSST